MKSIANRTAWLGATTALLIAGTTGIASADSATNTTTSPNNQTATQQTGAATTAAPATIPHVAKTSSQETKMKNQPVRRAERGTKSKH